MMDKDFLRRIHDETPYMYIGKVVEHTGATRKAIRHYEEIGLIPPAKRKGKYRIYSERDVFLIHMIKTAQSVGFSLEDLRELVQLKVNEKQFPLEFAKILFSKKRESLEGEIKELENQIAQLDHLFQSMLEHFS
jgi:MerR family copper efflux transcriptional regulator